MAAFLAYPHMVSIGEKKWDSLLTGKTQRPPMSWTLNRYDYVSKPNTEKVS